MQPVVLLQEGYIGIDRQMELIHSVVVTATNEFATDTRHINGIESFWVFAKQILI
jgi:hypothetical protein